MPPGGWNTEDIGQCRAPDNSQIRQLLITLPTLATYIEDDFQLENILSRMLQQKHGISLLWHKTIIFVKADLWVSAVLTVTGHLTARDLWASSASECQFKQIPSFVFVPSTDLCIRVSKVCHNFKILVKIV
jgi:hypothetical protein